VSALACTGQARPFTLMLIASAMRSLPSTRCDLFLFECIEAIEAGGWEQAAWLPCARVDALDNAAREYCRAAEAPLTFAAQGH
jgi:hypothetical protein